MGPRGRTRPRNMKLISQINVLTRFSFRRTGSTFVARNEKMPGQTSKQAPCLSLLRRVCFSKGITFRKSHWHDDLLRSCTLRPSVGKRFEVRITLKGSRHRRLRRRESALRNRQLCACHNGGGGCAAAVRLL